MQLHREAAAFTGKGASLAFVGIGSPDAIRDFRQETGATEPAFADPTLATYRALGMRRGALTYLSPGFIANAIRALRSGYRNRFVAGDSMQHGGVLIVKPGGEVVYRYTSKTAGDHPAVRDVLGAR